MFTPDPGRRIASGPSAGPISDAAAATLMAAYAGGDRRAWDPLFDGLAPRLLGFFQRALPDPESAEQYVEATFLELHRARHTYRRGSPVRPWVFRLAVRVRVEGREDGPDRSGRRAAAGALRTGIPGESAREQLVWEAFEGLSVPERMAIHLHRSERMTFVELAEVFGWTEEAARREVVHAYRALRARLWMLGDAGGGP